MSRPVTHKKKTRILRLVSSVLVFLVPGLLMLVYPQLFVDGLWNSINLTRVMGGIFVVIFVVMMILRHIIPSKNRS